MEVQEFQPRAPLDRHIKTIWILEADSSAHLGKPERIVADGIVEVVFHFARPFLTSHAGGPYELQPTSFAISQLRRHVLIRPSGKCGFLAIRFYPWGAHHFFDMPVSEFADRLIPTRDLWGRSAVELEERIALAADHKHRVALVEQFLRDQLRRRNREGIEPVVRHIWQTRGEAPVRELARAFGFSERQLQRKFEQALGAPPKQIARITRFLGACRTLRDGEYNSLAELAHGCGYYDQSHFIREFEQFSGLTPTEFLAESAVSFLDVES